MKSSKILYSLLLCVILVIAYYVFSFQENNGTTVANYAEKIDTERIANEMVDLTKRIVNQMISTKDKKTADIAAEEIIQIHKEIDKFNKLYCNLPDNKHRELERIITSEKHQHIFIQLLQEVQRLDDADYFKSEQLKSVLLRKQ